MRYIVKLNKPVIVLYLFIVFIVSWFRITYVTWGFSERDLDGYILVNELAERDREHVVGGMVG